MGDSASSTPGRTARAPTWLPYAPGLFVALWSTGFIGARYAMPYAEPLTFLSVRFVLAAGLLGAACLLRRTPMPRWRAAGHALVAGALIHGVYLGAVFWAIAHGMPAAISALVVGLQPLLTAFLAQPLLGEAIGRRHWQGLGMGLVGLVLVIGPKLEFAAEGITPATTAVCMIGVLAISAGSIYQKRFCAGINLRSATFLQFVGALAVVALGALAAEEFTIVWNGPVIFALTWLVFVLSIVSVSLYLVLIRYGDVSRVAGLFYLVPAVTALMAFAMFGDTLSWVQFLGMGASGLAVMLVMRKE